MSEWAEPKAREARTRVRERLTRSDAWRHALQHGRKELRMSEWAEPKAREARSARPRTIDAQRASPSVQGAAQ